MSGYSRAGTASRSSQSLVSPPIIGGFVLVALGALFVVNIFVSYPPSSLHDECADLAQRIQAMASDSSVSASAKEASMQSMGGVIGSC